VTRVDVVERQIETFVMKYTPEIADVTRSSRIRMQAVFPRGHEFVYDNYNALVFGYSPTPRPSDAVASIAAYPRWVTLFLLKGAGIEDPRSSLKGAGKQVRSITLESARDLDSAGIRALLRQVIARRAREFRDAPALTTVVRSVSARQRPRRPAVRGAATSRPLTRTRRSATDGEKKEARTKARRQGVASQRRSHKSHVGAEPGTHGRR